MNIFPHRKVEELSGESLGLQDALLEVSAEAAAGELRQKQLAAEQRQQQEQLDQLQTLLTEREAQLTQCRAASALPHPGMRPISAHTPGAMQDRWAQATSRAALLEAP